MTQLDTSKPPMLPPRDPRGHKGTFGTVAVVGGCACHDTPMIGAPALAARAAFRSGCGLVRLAMPGPILLDGLKLTPSATGIGLAVDDRLLPSYTEEAFELIAASDALVLGPGLGADRSWFYPIAKLVCQCLSLGLPSVVDADGLNALAAGDRLTKIDLSRCILTPHPGEFARLAAACGIDLKLIDEDERPQAAAALAEKLGCVVVLKGAGTVVSDGANSWVCDRGHSCLATAGTGDVLAGLTGSLLAQMRQSDMSLYDIARIAVSVHAIAGERWANRTQADAGMLAAELADELPGLLSEFRD